MMLQAIARPPLQIEHGTLSHGELRSLVWEAIGAGLW